MARPKTHRHYRSEMFCDFRSFHCTPGLASLDTKYHIAIHCETLCSGAYHCDSKVFLILAVINAHGDVRIF